MEKRRGAYSILVGRPRDRWWDDIKMDLQKWGGAIDWIDSEKWNYPTVSEKLTFCDS